MISFWLYTPQILHKVFLMWKCLPPLIVSLHVVACGPHLTDPFIFVLIDHRFINPTTQLFIFPWIYFPFIHQRTSPLFIFSHQASLCSSRQPTSRQFSKYPHFIHQIVFFFFLWSSHDTFFSVLNEKDCFLFDLLFLFFASWLLVFT